MIKVNDNGNLQEGWKLGGIEITGVTIRGMEYAEEACRTVKVLCGGPGRSSGINLTIVRLYIASSRYDSGLGSVEEKNVSQDV